ncbi:MAG: hypothetical protein QXE81_05215 [Desulfurococcaceae archaeon]
MIRHSSLLTSCEVWIKSPQNSVLFRILHGELRKFSFRAHYVEEVYIYAKSTARANKRDNSRRLLPKRLTARLNEYDYKLDLESETLI